MMGTRTFTPDLHRAFATLSGDFNPMHMDPVAARRLLFGAPVVHGIHALLWVLDEAVAGGGGGAVLRTLQGVFRQPILLEERAECFFETEPGLMLKGGLRVGQRVCVDLRAEFVEGAPSASPGDVPDRNPAILPCLALTFEEVAAAKGDVELAFSREVAGRLFTHLARRFSPGQMAVLLATTRVVGMCCPGEHSLFAEISLDFTAGLGPEGRLAFATEQIDARFSRVVLKVSGREASGRIIAFYRPPPVHQVRLSDLAGVVRRDEFADRRALVVGGSRGLGEAAAKIIAAGGGEVLVTCHRGRSDAERVAAEVRTASGRAAVLELDVTWSGTELAAALARAGPVNHLLYFASPRIERRKDQPFAPDIFHRFTAHYVDGLAKVVGAAWKRGSPLAVLYPSTVYLDEPNPDFPEYVAAKAAGEAICRVLERKMPGVHTWCPRLPRLRTDQTAALMASPTKEPATVLLPVLREMVL